MLSIPLLYMTLLAGRSATADTVLVIEGMAAGRQLVDRYRTWHFYAENPILTADGDLEMQAGEGNVYAPDVLRTEDGYLMWYGGQGRDGHDRIHLARSDDGLHWTRIDENPVIDVNGSNHVNDPSVVRVDGTFYMVYSDAPTDEKDEIHAATSTDGVHWERKGAVIPLGPAGAWDSFKVGRPSILYEDGRFRMWYDGTNSDPLDPRQIGRPARRHVGIASSVDGVHWTKAEENPVVLDQGAIDVERVGARTVLLAEGRDGTRWFTSDDGIRWNDEGMLFKLSGEAYDRAGQVTPMAYVEDGVWVAVYFGGAKEANWNRNRIAVAFAQKGVVLRDPTGAPIDAIVRALDRDTAIVRVPGAYEALTIEIVAPDGETRLATMNWTAEGGSTRLRVVGDRLIPVE